MAENVIFGTGPLGLAVARRLVSSGKAVRLVNRSGKAQGPPGAEVFAADATDPAAARRACEGATVVFHCATHSYGQWDKVLPPIMNGIIEGAAAASARIVYGDNLYAYGPVDGPIREDLPYRPLGPNTRARAEVATTLMNAHASGKVRATVGRASDFYGPDARQSKAGDGIFARAIAGKPAQVVGNPDLPHTLTFIDDFAAALVTLSQQDRALGESWHVPNAETVTTRRFVEMVFDQLHQPRRLQPVPPSSSTCWRSQCRQCAASRKRCISHNDPGWWITASTSVPSARSRRLTHPRSQPPWPGSGQALNAINRRGCAAGAAFA